MTQLIIYLVLFLIVLGGLGYWIFKARSAFKSVRMEQQTHDPEFMNETRAE